MTVLDAYRYIREQKELEILKDDKERERKRAPKMTQGQKRLVLNKLEWTVTEVARCIKAGYILVATINTPEVAYRKIYTDYVEMHDDVLRYGKQFRPRYIQYIKKNREFIIHIEHFKYIGCWEWWRSNPSELIEDYIHKILYDKGRMSLDMYERITKK